MIIQQGQLPINFSLSRDFSIVSLVPSISWYLEDLGLLTQVTGITKFCILRNNLMGNISSIGGTKNPNIQEILRLQPDLIVANKEENRKEDIELLSKYSTVYLTEVANFDQMLEMMKEIGIICHRIQEAHQWTQSLQQQFMSFKQELSLTPLIPVCYLIWKNPLMTVGQDTFIHFMLESAGFQNAFSHLKRYPVISEQEIYKSKAINLFLSSEPFPFQEKHLAEFAKIPSYLVDGRMFSWYGSFMQNTFSYLEALKYKTTQHNA